MNLTVNGRRIEIPAESTGLNLLAQLGIPASTAVAEVNGQIVPRQQFEDLLLNEGDSIELVTLVGGG